VSFQLSWIGVSLCILRLESTIRGGRPERFLDENSGVLWDVETEGRRNFCSEEKLQNDG
jgi:hypothetical protein